MTIKATKVRWMMPKDWPEVMDIEEEAFGRPWLRIDFERTAQKRSSTILVAECDCEVVGYLAYERLARLVVLQRLAVHCKYRRTGAGSTLVKRLKQRLTGDIKKIICDVNEYWVPAQMMLSREGFVCTESIDDYYGDDRDKASFYRFEYTEDGDG